MMSDRWPDFFIVGAPKCGTTSLFEYLRQHPDLHLLPDKEIHFFGNDLKWRTRYHPVSRYRELIEAAQMQTILGEASVFYMASRSAAAEIHGVAPDAKIIVMLRDPVDMIHSLYVEGLRSGSENLVPFEKAFEAETERKLGRLRVTRDNPGVEEANYYSEIALYSEQLERYLDLFGTDQVHIIFFEDLKRDPAEVYAKVCGFLGVNEAFVPNFEIHNEHKAIRNFWIWRLVKHPPDRLRALWRSFFPRWLRSAVLSRVGSLYLGPKKRSDLSPEIKQKIREIYRKDVVRLSELTGRDLSNWLRIE